MIAASASAPVPLISVISRVEKDAGYGTNVLARSSFLGVGGVCDRFQGGGVKTERSSEGPYPRENVNLKPKLTQVGCPAGS